MTESAAYVDISGFASPRVYDFIVRDPIASQYIGVEVKTTFFDTIFLNRSQDDPDVALYEGGFGKMRGTEYLITEVAYEAFCGSCAALNIRYLYLALRLSEAGITVRQHLAPGDADPPF